MALISMDTAIRHVTTGEGKVPYMYLDNAEVARGGPFVTVGIGIQLPTEQSAREIASSFLATETKPDGKVYPARPATDEEVRTVYNQVAARSGEQAKSKPALRAASFEKNNTIRKSDGSTVELRLAESAAATRARSHVQKTIGQLRGLFPEFESFPSQAQLALIDMVYNMGLGSEAKPNQKATGFMQFRKLIAAVRERNWALAAQECRRRPPVPESRNAETRKLFLEAARKAESLHVGPFSLGKEVRHPGIPPATLVRPVLP